MEPREAWIGGVIGIASSMLAAAAVSSLCVRCRAAVPDIRDGSALEQTRFPASSGERGKAESADAAEQPKSLLAAQTAPADLHGAVSAAVARKFPVRGPRPDRLR